MKTINEDKMIKKISNKTSAVKNFDTIIFTNKRFVEKLIRTNICAFSQISQTEVIKNIDYSYALDIVHNMFDSTTSSQEQTTYKKCYERICKNALESDITNISKLNRTIVGQEFIRNICLGIIEKNPAMLLNIPEKNLYNNNFRTNCVRIAKTSIASKMNNFSNTSCDFNNLESILARVEYKNNKIENFLKSSCNKVY